MNLRILILVPLLLVACTRAEPEPAPLAGATIGGPFALVDGTVKFVKQGVGSKQYVTVVAAEAVAA